LPLNCSPGVPEMRSTTEFAPPSEGISPAKPLPRLPPNEFTMSTPTMTKVARTEIKPRAATRDRNIPQSSLRDVSMEFIVSSTRIEEHPPFLLLSLEKAFTARHGVDGVVGVDQLIG
jgi:hypothetical protein